MARNIFLEVFVVALVSVALAIPCEGGRMYKQKHCIKMTPHREQEIQTIVEKIGQFLHSIHQVHDEFDVRLVKIDIESHTENEDEKDTKIEITVNDCPENNVIAPKSSDTKVVETKKSVNEENTKFVEVKKVDSTSEIDVISKPPTEVFRLDLEENGKELISEIEKSRGKKYNPLVVYVQEAFGGKRKQYTLLN